MLEIRNVSKIYRTGSLTQQALDGVSLSLRDNEFVAVLGQSGSGKTTLLNIIGGLDRYDEGNLIINGVSTERYTSRDWDSYRNHTVGFVFQSYNLIPHQTILQNVELALTISGIPRAQRTARAREALTKVGLADHIHKRPSQLSGGQMQRVAIARALVNDPDILLADEPTGALDSETSIQVMDLLREVASDRLVVMVTHNPELAHEYATRIVELRDGRIISDSDPYVVEEAAPATHRNMGRASMSFLTALSLSFNNLRTKKARTILVSFAGSIGIIGIALIMSMSNGADKYIKGIEQDSLQDYPLQITDSSFNIASMYSAARADLADTEQKGDVKEQKTVTRMLSGVTTNDLKSLKNYFESGDSDIDDYVQSIEYDYNMSPYIYRYDGDDYRQVNPDTSFTALGFNSGASLNGLFSAISSTDIFDALPDNDERLQRDYELVAGDWPQNYDECVVLLNPAGRITDLTLYAMGLRDADELDLLVRSFVDGETAEVDESEHWYDYDDLIGTEFRILPSSSLYTYDKDHKVWTSRSEDKKYMKSLLSDAETMCVVGVIKPGEDNSMLSAQPGIGYTSALISHLSDRAADSKIVRSQLDSPDTNVFTGKRFDEEQAQTDLDMSSLFKVDSKALSDAFGFDPDAADLSSLDLSGLDLSGMDFSDMDLSAINPDDLDLSALSSYFPSLSADDLSDLFEGLGVELSSEKLRSLFEELLSGYMEYAASDPATDYTLLPQAVSAYLRTDDARQLLYDQLSAIIDENSQYAISADDLSALVEHILSGYPQYLVDHNLEDDGSMAHLNDYLTTDEARALMDESTASLREQFRKLLPSDEQMATLSKALLNGYDAYAEKNSLPVTSRLIASFSEYLTSEDVQQLISDEVFGELDTDAIEQMFSGYADQMNGAMAAVMQQVVSTITSSVTDAMSRAMASLIPSLTSGMEKLFDFDPASLANALSMKMSAEEISNLMLSLLNPETTSYDANLKKLGYVDVDRPSTISIYPKDFDSKTRVKAIIDDYNTAMKEAGDDDKVIQYTDMVDALMGSVTDIINAISYVLIAFVAISLVVSSLMIGVITYISVLERKKEIGILRAIGASKRNISEVFNAETFIIGLLAGIIGIGITLLLLIPINAILHALVGQVNISAVLPPTGAAGLIVLSVILTFIGGLIPSRKASRSDPVLALRSE